MIKEEIKIQKLTASDNMVLYNGETYSKEVYLSHLDSVDSWKEIPEEDVPEEILSTL